MKYIGEHLLPGQLGHFLIVLSLIASLVATIAYFKAANATTPQDHDSWKKLARAAFFVDAVSVLTTFGIIFYIIANHYHEYFYAWNHSDVTLNPKYLLSSIWEGQEGAFLLWTLWQSILGLVLIKTSKRFEAPVMTVMSFAQFCLATLILGVYVFDLKVGSSPFLLTRHQFQDAPVFSALDYLKQPKIANGNGLNQLLQNYWMVIHPPVLFLGYAST
ncbi:MAG TPA: cytochrome c assembly protein, partial [Niastella sp.]